MKKENVKAFSILKSSVMVNPQNPGIAIIAFSTIKGEVFFATNKIGAEHMAKELALIVRRLSNTTS